MNLTPRQLFSLILSVAVLVIALAALDVWHQSEANRHTQCERQNAIDSLAAAERGEPSPYEGLTRCD